MAEVSNRNLNSSTSKHKLNLDQYQNIVNNPYNIHRSKVQSSKNMPDAPRPTANIFSNSSKHQLIGSTGNLLGVKENVNLKKSDKVVHANSSNYYMPNKNLSKHNSFVVSNHGEETSKCYSKNHNFSSVFLPVGNNLTVNSTLQSDLSFQFNLTGGHPSHLTTKHLDNMPRGSANIPASNKERRNYSKKSKNNRSKENIRDDHSKSKKKSRENTRPLSSNFSGILNANAKKLVQV